MATTYQGTSEGLKDLFIVALRNAHALEKQALSIMTPQVARIENYPEVAERLRAHIEETNGQLTRLDELLADLDTSGSALKDLGLSLTGSMAAITHSIAGDEILKNSFANYAFENFEIAAYKSLITLAEHGGFASATPALEQTLREEQAMAQWIDEALPMVTRRYADLYVTEGSSEAKV
ncbi:ferritin-like domain-containing protein [Sphingomonas sp. M1-B02]|uniref:ferritin-like domain-containing protein n=1 Tax=Sphingomonas sp. M1-B02 TaxID=3114300 RepID=UPI00224093A1|nr:ferritin-like domain-containing protein [Sphingomonas sp. S6-11]UZK67792.1 ferritin-like domain-containing protein [Sphingomonas sp. S6-11]